MMLSGKEIQKHLNDGIVIEPFNENQVNPNSYNLRLGEELLIYRIRNLDMKRNNPVDRIVIPESGYLLQPDKLYLGHSVEKVGATSSKDGIYYTWIVEGRSSIGRLGITTQVAGFGDNGFIGNITWQISCVQPVYIYPNIEFGQIYYFPILGEVEPYKGKYLNSVGATSSRMFEDFKKYNTTEFLRMTSDAIRKMNKDQEGYEWLKEP